MTAARVELDKSNAAFEQSTSNQALAAEICRELVVQPVHFLCTLCFFVNIHYLGGTRLHAVRQLVRLDAGGQFRLARPRLQMLAIELAQKVQSMTLRAVADTRRSGQIE